MEHAQAEEQREAGEVHVALRVELLRVVVSLRAVVLVVDVLLVRLSSHLEHALERVDEEHCYKDERDADRVVDLGDGLAGCEEVEELAAHRERQRHNQHHEHGHLEYQEAEHERVV